MVSDGSSKLTSYFKSSELHNKELDLVSKETTYGLTCNEYYEKIKNNIGICIEKNSFNWKV